jgi:hypothetical protein
MKGVNHHGPDYATNRHPFNTRLWSDDVPGLDYNNKA